jgi:hypothetical protein
MAKTRRAAERTLRGARALNTRRDELTQPERERLDSIVRTATALTRASTRGKSMADLRAALEGGQ